MKKASTASLFALLLSLPAVAAAAVPQTLAFSARIADNGRPVTGSHTVKFTFWDCDGTNPATCVDPTNVLWKETQTLTATDGVITAVLGADTTTPNPLPPAIFNGGPLFLEVTFDGTAFTPRMTINSVPYAIRSGVVDSVAANLAAGPGNNPFGSLAQGDNYALAPAFVPPANGYCIVATSVSLYGGTSATTTAGPFYRIAVQRAGANGDDGLYGLYPGPLALGAYANMSRTRVIPVNAGESTAFGCALRSAPAEWAGKYYDCIVDNMCFY